MKIYINKLKNTSVYKLFLNNYFLIAFFVLLAFVSFINKFCILLLMIYGLHLFNKAKPIFSVSLVISIIILGHFFYLNYTYKLEEVTNLTGEIIEIKDTEYGRKYLVKTRGKKYLVYDYNTNLQIKYGDVVFIKGIAKDVSTNRLRNGFNYQEYLKKQRIYGVINAKEIKVIKHKFNISIIKHYFLKYLKRYFAKDSYIFLKAMLIGDLDDLDDEYKNAIIDNGILHLFAISGLHIVLFVGLIEKVLKTINLNDKQVTIINFLLLILYLVLTSFSASVLRAALMYYFSKINKFLKLNLSSLDIISIIFLLLLIFNPYYIYNLGFNLSFLSSTIIILSIDLLQNYHKYLQVFIISLFTNILTFPLVINLNHKLNLLSPISNVIFIELVEGVILPLSFFIIVFPIFSNFYNYLILAFKKLTIFFSKIFVINISFPYLGKTAVVIYYLSLYFYVKVYKQRTLKTLLSFLLVLFFSAYSNITYLYPKEEV